MGGQLMSKMHIPFRTKCVTIKNTNKAISLKSFAAKNFISESTVFYWLRTNKAKGYKSFGRWYIYLA
jgi:hypothetical protein